MSTSLHDPASAGQVVLVRPPASVTDASTATAAVDLVNGDGRCFGVQTVGAVSDLTGLVGAFQESADGAAWVDVPDATFATVTAANTVQVVGFTRTQRYVRWVPVTIDEGAAATVGVVLLQQKKTV